MKAGVFDCGSSPPISGKAFEMKVLAPLPTLKAVWPCADGQGAGGGSRFWVQQDGVAFSEAKQQLRVWMVQVQYHCMGIGGLYGSQIGKQCVLAFVP